MTHTEAFVDYLRNIRGVCERTGVLYGGELRRLSAFMVTRGKALETATPEDFVAWIAEQRATSAPATFQLRAKAARQFYVWAKATGVVAENPFPFDLRISNKNRTPTTVPTAKQFLTMRHWVNDEAKRNCGDSRTRKLIFEVLSGSGLRCQAMMTLKAEHLHMESKRPSIVVDPDTMACKGKTGQVIPITPYCAELLRLGCLGLAPGATIVQTYGSSVRRLCNAAGRVIGIPFLHPHSLRGFYACMTYYRSLDGTRYDSVWVRDAMGHSNMVTTDRYLKFARTVCTNDDDWFEWATGKKTERVLAVPAVPVEREAVAT